ncbi:hypothetical protein Cgig2_010265 [Carnegiea gigantea]|uniref:DNA-directed DNA polymerase n=1 Tax=Carnegiea gigantea TaxID=171969 RepID=A0A9Q1KEV5_9CARY|nr:hypothetical protein Cgig2_010265 [Carnegiea gigantea]
MPFAFQEKPLTLDFFAICEPKEGYLIEKKDSPFKGFGSHLYESRLESKKSGDEAMSYFYKILMNSLYGRFGVDPKSTVTEICNQKKYEELMKMNNFQCVEQLTDHYYIVNCITNKNNMTDNTEWDPLTMSVIQLSAAIIACARIHMYPYISREDCYYIDTDSVVLGSPLPDEVVSSIEIGKFKLERHVKRGIFLAPKSYMLDIEDDRHIIKHKSPAKDLSTKRDNVCDDNNVWIDTRPREVIDLGSKDATTIYISELLREKDKNPVITDKSTKQEEVSQSPTEGQKTKPTLYNTKAAAKKAAKKAKKNTTSV